MEKKSAIPATIAVCVGFTLVALLLHIYKTDKMTGFWLLDGAALVGLLAGYGIDKLRGV